MKFQRQPSFAETGLFQSRMSFRQRADAKKETEVQRHMIPLKTAIADDDRYICQQIQECLMQYSTQKDIDIDDPDIYTDCATLYNTDFTQKRYDLVFMDIDFSGGTEPVKSSTTLYHFVPLSSTFIPKGRSTLGTRLWYKV